jgi:hypothetical protein
MHTFNDKHTSHTLPIQISKHIINNNEQHSTKNGSFDPTQNSPPSLWKTRLSKRLGDSPIKYEYNSKRPCQSSTN